MSTIFNPSTRQNPEKASEFEEQIWLEHQQQLHGEGQQAFAWKLDNRVDTGRLVNALNQALGLLCGANRIYDYDDESGLLCRPIPAPPVVAVQSVLHTQQARDALLKEKETPIDLAQMAPLRFRLFIGEQNGIFGMIIHDILSASLDLQTILQTVSALYQKQSCPPHAAVAISQRLSPPADARILAHCGSLSERYSGGQSSGANLSATLPASEGDDEIAALAVWAAKFALTLSERVENARVTLCFAGDRLQSTTIAPLTLACEGKPIAGLARQIQRHLQGNEMLSATAEEGVSLLIQWRRARLPELRLDDAVCPSLWLPPGHTRWPLVVTFSDPAQIDIIAGAQLAGWVGEYLLFKSLGLQTTDFYPATSRAATTLCPPSEPTIQQRILDAFREALAMPEMGENDDFFDCGGHSLIATRIIGRLKSQHRIEININDLFSHPCAAQLAMWARIDAPQPAVSTTENRYANPLQAPLSLAQKSLWKIYKALGFSEAFNIPFALRFLDSVNEEIFRQAFSDILVRHSALRSVFVDIAGEIYQQVIPPEMLSQYDWFWFSNEQGAVPLETALKRAAEYHFELDNELPIRITFLKDENNGQQVVSLLFHHIVLDEWSVNILMDELAQAVASRSAGLAPVWQQLPVPFHAFALQQNEEGLNDHHLHFWLERLRGVTPARSIFASKQETRETSDTRGGWVEFKVERAVSKGLYQLAKRQGASLFNVVYGGIAAALHLLGGMKELVIGTSASGRNDAQFFDTIGYFTTVVAHRIIFDNVPGLNALINDVKRQINDSMPYTDIPIDRVEEALFGDGLAQDSHMFEVFIQIHAKNKLNGAFNLADGRGVRFRQVDPEKTESVLGLQFEVMEEQVAGESDVRVMMSYRADRYSPDQVEQITRTTQQVFTAMASAAGGPDISIDSLRAATGITGQ
ncbi:chromosome condensation protein [Citrobacter amalonaticus]|uniref:Chromosome condensation protein n=1 Tax=Citrobacter amalonaticus TaxID=35703 RepID=A0A2S4S082_CITAM|nr:condensation domain-containing protein [Citrobacter amalonaticus]POT58302.1 chromosome condensation protein [Citrobacter amalonaticus]POT76173.1 chromosome condensation protein [Citrobacter amalonaticus]POU66829.1 chromosome condensation protein [Citrobacter amalonaticus]POV05408.1 chromosome condensation protein [Citrobacter amalonaticus]